MQTKMLTIITTNYADFKDLTVLEDSTKSFSLFLDFKFMSNKKYLFLLNFFTKFLADIFQEM